MSFKSNMPAKPNLLLLHGALGAKEQFDELLPLLQGKFRLHTLSFSGHGKTKSVHHSFTIQNFVHEVLQWMNQKQIMQVNVFGYSMGGYVGLWLARYYPARIHKLMTLGTKLKWSEEEAARETKFLVPEKVREKVPAFAQQLADRHGEHEWHSVMQKTAHLMHDLAKHHLKEEDFRRIITPTLLLRGDGDNMVTAEETQQLCEWMPSATFKQLDGTPHPFEQVSQMLLAGEAEQFFLA